MLPVLVIVFALVLALVGVAALVRRLGLRFGRRRTLDRLVGNEHMPEDVRQTAREMGRSRMTAAHGGMRTKPRPSLSAEQRRAILHIRAEEREDYLEHLHPGFYQFLIIFVVCSVVGLFVEMFFMYVTYGRTDLRVGLVWGPFSPLYGFGGLTLTFILWYFRKSKPIQVFLISACVGGALEQVAGMGMSYFAHAESWTYAYLPDSITEWVAWRYLLMWGVIGLVWYKLVMPELLFIIGKPTRRGQMVVVILITVFLSVDVIATLVCFARKGARDAGIPPANAFDVYVDDHFSDQFIEDRFQNLVIGERL